MSQLKKGALLSYANIFLTNIIGLILTPFIIRSLGDSEYGLYTLIGAFVAQIYILNLGLNNTIIRYVSKYRVEKDKQGEKDFLSSIMLIYCGISLMVIIIGVILYLNMDIIFKDSLTAVELQKAKPMLVVLILNLAIALPGGTFEAICNAYEKFVFPRALSLIKYVSRATLIFVLLGNYPNAMTLIWIDTLLNITIIATTAYFVFKKLKIRFAIQKPNFSLFKEIFSYTIWIFLFAIAYRLQWFSGQTVLGITTDTVTVAIYGVGILLGGYYGAFAGAINTLLLPKATRLSVQKGDAQTYTDTMIQVGKINMFVLMPIISGFYLFGQSFISLWVGDVYKYAWWIAFLIMLVMTLPLVQAFGNSILEALKKNKFRSIFSMITLIIATIVSYFLSKVYGINGVIYSLTTAVFLNSLLLLWYFNKTFELNIKKFINKVFIKSIITTVALSVVFSILLKTKDINNWFVLGLWVSIFMLVYLLINYFFVLDKKTKSIIFRIQS